LFSTTDFAVALQVQPGMEEGSRIRVQVEIEWTNSAKQRLLRIESTSVTVSNNRAQLEKNADLSVPALAAIRRCAALAQQSLYDDARVVLISTLRLLQRGMRSRQSQVEYVRFIKQGERLDGFMRELKQQAEMFAVFSNDKKNASSDVKRDDYVARNIHRSKAMTLSEWCL
jgi:hypothetical protein